MGWNFRRSINLGGGVRLNFSKGGMGISAGVKGFRVSTGPRGTRMTASIPGTGIYYTKQLSSKSSRTVAQPLLPTRMFQQTVENDYTGESRQLQADSQWELDNMVRTERARQMQNETRQRQIAAAAEGAAKAQQMTQEIRKLRQEYQRIIETTLAVDDTLDWNAQYNNQPYSTFVYDPESGKTKSQALSDYLDARDKYEYARLAHNSDTRFLQEQYEKGEELAVEKYVAVVLANSKYPANLDVDYNVNFDRPSKRLVVKLLFPSKDAFPFVDHYSYSVSTREYKAVDMPESIKNKFYARILWAVSIRTVSEVFEAVHIDVIDTIGIIGYLLDEGSEEPKSILHIRFDRNDFEKLDISDTNVDEVVSRFKHQSDF